MDCDSPGTVLQLFPLSSDNFEVTFEGLLEAIFSVSRLEIREEFHPVGHKQFNSYQLDGEGKLKTAYQLEEKIKCKHHPQHDYGSQLSWMSHASVP